MGRPDFLELYTVPDEVIVTLALGRPESDPTASTFFTMSMPSETSPKTTCLPSSHDVTTVVIKNWRWARRGLAIGFGFGKGVREALTWEPFVFGPALAMDSRPGLLCRSLKFSSDGR